jgi:hypothetical protein
MANEQGQPTGSIVLASRYPSALCCEPLRRVKAQLVEDR